MSRLSAEQLLKGVIAASAGNHAQGVALSAQKLKTKAVIVMPQTTPSIKIDAVTALGGEVILFGNSYDEAFTHARKLELEHGLTFIHPFDDLDVITGQATVAIEILRQLSGPLDAIYVAVGGGGLIAGVASIVRTLRPDVKVIGVEAEDSACFSAARSAGVRTELARVGRFADGVAVKIIGEKTFEIANPIVDEIVIVSNDEICGAIKEIFEDRRAILEPAGALAYAGLKRHVLEKNIKGQSLVAIACGANVNFDTLRHVSERAESGERREAVLSVTIPERAGSFREFILTLGDLAITEFNYRYSDSSKARVFVGLRISNVKEGQRVVENLIARGYSTIDLTENELAKLHIRHMVGGRAPDATHERLISFIFPERSGALLQFLDAMKHPFNISLFHYRNHGSDYGRVLAGIQVPPKDAAEFEIYLTRLGYEYIDETDNPACKLFLQ